ncbi:MAG: PAS domain S-box protein [Planctomycetales bacterium]
MERSSVESAASLGPPPAVADDDAVPREAPAPAEPARGTALAVEDVSHMVRGAEDDSTGEGLRRRNDLFRAIFEASAMGIVLADPATGRLLRFNDKYRRITGYTTAELRELTFPELTHPDDRDADWADYQRLVRGEMPEYTVEKRYVRKDGRAIWVRVDCIIARDDRGRPAYDVAFVRDITDSKETLRELEALNETLEQRIVERTAVAEQRARQLRRLAAELTQAEQRERRRLAQILHDHLQQLLVAAKLNVGLMRRQRSEEALQLSLNQLDALLTESIGTARTLTAELSPPVLHDAGLLPALEWLARHMQEKHGLQVEVDAGPGTEPEGEELRTFLFQAARELLFNAVKHAGVGEARVTTRLAEDDELLLLVEDAGRGFDPAAADHEEADGGFGLFHVRERTEMQGGRMEIDSAPGEGTRVALYLPRAAATEAASVAEAERGPHVAPSRGFRPAAGPAGEDGRIRVLLVDDHRILRDGLARVIEDQPDLHLVGEAADGLEGIALAHAARPHVVVMDISMPRLDGLEATRRLTAELPGAKIIGLSMHEHEDMESAMRGAGAVGYVLKGSPSEILLDAIRRCAAAASPSPMDEAR